MAVSGAQIATMTGATAGTAGKKGVVPAPAAGDHVKYLRGDETWQAISDAPVPIHCISDGTSVLVKDGVGRFPVPASLNGFELVNVEVRVTTAGGTSGATSVRVYNETDTVSMLSTNVTLDYNQTYVADGVIDTAHDDVATGDLIRVDVVGIPSGGAPSGLYVILTFREA